MNVSIEVLKQIGEAWKGYQENVSLSDRVAQSDNADRFESRMTELVEEAELIIEESEVV